jgi:protein gp37
MSDKTGIAWTDATWNPVTGCSKVSPGCAHCYAEALSKRFGRSFEVTLHPERLDEPLHWRKPRRVFVCSMADLFHEQVDDPFIAQVWAVMALARRHTFQVLTKRPDRALTHLTRVDAEVKVGRMALPFADDNGLDWDVVWRKNYDRWPLPNLWLGVSIEDARFIERADILRQTPAAVRFVSAEPLLGPLVGDPRERYRNLDLTGIDWLIIGGESGPHARPMDPQWARDLIAAARAAGTAVFVKQMGGLRPGGPLPDEFNIREYPP